MENNTSFTQTKQEQNEDSRSIPMDLAVCPDEIRALDSNAEILWIKFLRRTGIPMSAKATKGKNASKDLWVDNNCRRAAIIRGFGVQSLIQRLSAAKDEICRARVWWRESAACAEGETVPDLATENMAILNPFIVTRELKFENKRLERMVKTWAEDAEANNSAVTRKASSLSKRIRQSSRMRSRTPKTASVGNTI